MILYTAFKVTVFHFAMSASQPAAPDTCLPLLPGLLCPGEAVGAGADVDEFLHLPV